MLGIVDKMTAACLGHHTVIMCVQRLPAEKPCQVKSRR